MSKNLGQYKQELQTRECLVQAIYQYIFSATSLSLLVEQFLEENTPKKISVEATAKVIEIEKLDSEYARIELKLTQFDAVEWKSLTDIYSNRQEQVLNLLKEIRGY